MAAPPRWGGVVQVNEKFTTRRRPDSPPDVSGQGKRAARRGVLPRAWQAPPHCYHTDTRARRKAGSQLLGSCVTVWTAVTQSC